MFVLMTFHVLFLFQVNVDDVYHLQHVNVNNPNNLSLKFATRLSHAVNRIRVYVNLTFQYS